MNSPYALTIDVLNETWQCSTSRRVFPSVRDNLEVTLRNIGTLSPENIKLAVMRNGEVVAGAAAFTSGSGSTATATVSLNTDLAIAAMNSGTGPLDFEFKVYGASDPIFSCRVWVPVFDAGAAADVPAQAFSAAPALISEETVDGVTYIVVKFSDGTVLQRWTKP